MKIFRDVILGIVIGAVLFGGVFMYKQPRAIAEDPVESPITATGVFNDMLTRLGVSRLDFDDVFGSAIYENLYLMTYGFVLADPEDSALSAVAMQYGLTPQEASAVQNGSLAPLIHMASLGGSLTQQDVANIGYQLRRDFDEAYELYSLQNELMTASSSAEIFANGDVTDSGFDLIHDLTVIEELLFQEKSPTSLGGPVTWGEETLPEDVDPYPPQQDDTEPGGTDAYEQIHLGLSGDLITLGEFNPPAILDDDVCPADESELEEALADYEEDVEDHYEEIETLESPLSEEPSQQEAKSFVDSLEVAEAAEWYEKLNCNGEMFLSGTASHTSDSKAADGEGEGEYVSKATYYICLEAKTKWETYSTFIPVDDCIMCELEKVQHYLEKTLSHSLTPNKVTGSYLETAKCKDSFAVPYVDLQFNLIWSPALTPPNDTAIYGKDIVREFDKLLKRSHPWGIPQLNLTYMPGYVRDIATKFAYQKAGWTYEGADGSLTLSEMMHSIDEIDASISKDRTSNLEVESVKSKGEDFIIYSQAIMSEINTMNMYFGNYKKLFKEIGDEICPAIVATPYMD